jgi:hypothetical protein
VVMKIILYNNLNACTIRVRTRYELCIFFRHVVKTYIPYIITISSVKIIPFLKIIITCVLLHCVLTTAAHRSRVSHARVHPIGTGARVTTTGADRGANENGNVKTKNETRLTWSCTWTSHTSVCRRTQYARAHCNGVDVTYTVERANVSRHNARQRLVQRGLVARPITQHRRAEMSRDRPFATISIIRPSHTHYFTGNAAEWLISRARALKNINLSANERTPWAYHAFMRYGRIVCADNLSRVFRHVRWPIFPRPVRKLFVIFWPIEMCTGTSWKTWFYFRTASNNKYDQYKTYDRKRSKHC